MNRQFAAGMEPSNAGSTLQNETGKLTSLDLQAGKRRALSTINTQTFGKNPFLNKQELSKGSFKVEERQVLPHQQQLRKGPSKQPTDIPRHNKGFTVFCDGDQNKENARRPHRNKITEASVAKQSVCHNKENNVPQSAFILESPGAQEDRDEEEILISGSPMVVDTSLVNNTLREQQNREYLLPEYSQDVYTYLKGVETRVRPRVNYMRKQNDISSGMRRILVDWLVEVCQEYKLDQETLFLAVSYIDRFLSYMSVLRSKLQLVGTACMFIAAKYEEIYPPDVSEFVYITDNTYTKQQVLRMEHLVLKVLAFDLAVPTANFFLQRLCHLCNVPTQTEYLARYLCELSLLEADPFLKYLPSEIACASLALSNHTLGKEMWHSELQLVAEYTEEDFRECLISLYGLYLEATTCPQQAIQEKYRSYKYHSVSSITPPPSLPPF